MKGFDLLITLKDDCVFSERNATSGAHKALDYIPGGALLGVAAGTLYKDQSTELAFEMFHSGKVRFTNAYPLTADGYRAFPMPACWHDAKNNPAVSGSKIDPSKVWRLDKLPNKKLDNNEQPKQLREGYVAENGDLAEPKKQLRMKTAIDPKTGRAKESSLFGYDALKAGQQFYAQLQLDDDVSDASLDNLKQVFSQQILLGRSRSAEYGRASVQVLEQPDTLSNGEIRDTKITLWLQSDLLAQDEYGQATLCPTSTDLGLPAGDFVETESFLRTRRYSTWNAHKHGYEMERQVICKGAVLVYELDTPLSEKQAADLSGGIGLERQAGLGQVWLNPPLLALATANPDFKKQGRSVLPTKPRAEEAPEKTALIHWLTARRDGLEDNQRKAAVARKEAGKYLGYMASVRKLKGFENTVFVGPSASQWGHLLGRIKNNDNLAQIKTSTDGSFKSQGEGWKDEFQTDGNITSFHAWFIAQMERQVDDKPVDHYFLSQLIREIMNKVKSVQGGQS